MKYEVLESNNYYHIFNQGNNGENIFIEDINYLYFFVLTKKYIHPIASILSCRLFKKYFYFLIQIKDVVAISTFLENTIKKN
ncbi:hypothetical protein SAMN05216503_0749 [Polaribacter sp. KT25b]|uniref:hypothetical protein n=1 Tax=Polaribacter sp. KT25b TaxID=1855336 RepID=UPI00087995A5|nr:hypothetical protein [Polaribacter sp. KT25b]SDR75209.1 hypothetical protein SAMN05216503_0749 [Polaribacter sp. KT25b]